MVLPGPTQRVQPVSSGHRQAQAGGKGGCQTVEQDHGGNWLICHPAGRPGHLHMLEVTDSQE